jgi:hypothetical protein
MSVARLIGVIGGLVCMAGGAYLVTLQAVAENNLFAAIAHGIGIYCIGKGMYVMTSSEFLSRIVGPTK